MVWGIVEFYPVIFVYYCIFANFFMARIIGVDYGKKRTGLAVTDSLQIIVSALDTVETPKLMDYFETYISKEAVEKIVIGLPVHADGNFTDLKGDIDCFATCIKRKFPHIEIDFADEQFSSVYAKQIILESGIKKKKRQDKSLIDKISAVVILQRYLKHI